MAHDTVHRLAVPCAQKLSSAQKSVPAKAPSGGFGTWLRGLLAVLRNERIRYLSIRDLSRLRDQDLRDIGIPRDRIDATVDLLMKRDHARRR